MKKPSSHHWFLLAGEMQEQSLAAGVAERLQEVVSELETAAVAAEQLTVVELAAVETGHEWVS